MASTSNWGEKSYGETSVSDADLLREYRYRLPVVCHVTTQNPDWKGDDDSGTGFLIGKNLIMVCKHHIPDEKTAAISRAHFFYAKESSDEMITVDLLPDKKTHDSGYFYSSQPPEPPHIPDLDFTLVGIQPDLRIEALAFRAFSIFDRVVPKKKWSIHVIEHPSDSDSVTKLLALRTIKKGKIRKANKNKAFIHHITYAREGASGAPVIDFKGRVIGIHTGRCNEKKHGDCKIATMMKFIHDSLPKEVHQGVLAKYEAVCPKTIPEILQSNYLRRGVITLLLGNRILPIESIYTSLAMIKDKEQKETQTELQEKKPGEQVEDGRIPTHESIFEAKKAIELEKLFQHEELKEKEKKRVLVLGAAGIGKSTLCNYIAYEWASGKLWRDEFEAVFWVQIRYLNRSFYPEKPAGQCYTSYELVANECQINDGELYSQLDNKKLRKKSLLILDGYDELPEEIGGNERAAYLKPAFDRLFKEFPNIIITSRPQIVKVAQNWAKLEILGFDAKGINSYIHNFFNYSDSALAQEKKNPKDLGASTSSIAASKKVLTKEEKLSHLMKRKPLIRSLAHVPINLEIICSLFDENQGLFESMEPLTVSAIYNELTNWLYKRFLLSRGSSGISTQTIEDYVVARDHPEVQPLAQALEALAWKAMVDNTLFIPQSALTPKISLEKARNFGLLRIEGPKASFVHLTFQEFLAGVYLAYHYIDEKREKAKSLIAQYKLYPRFALGFSMAAGYLSLQEDKTLLQDYFDDLLSEPYDLAVRCELNLLARCFEECRDTKQITQWDRFANAVAIYIETTPFEEFIIELLSRSSKLLHHNTILEAIKKGLATKKEQKKYFSIVRQIAVAGQNIPLAIIKKLGDCLRDPQADSYARRSAAAALGEIAKGGGEVPKEIVQALIDLLRDPQAGHDIREGAAHALKEIFNRGGEVPKETVQALGGMLRDPEASFYTRIVAVYALEKIGKAGGEFSKEAGKALVGVLKDPQADYDIRKSATSALGEIAKEGREFSKEVGKALVGLLREPRAGYDARKSAADVLEEIGKAGREFSKEAGKALVSVLRDPRADCYVLLGRVSYALGEIAKEGGEVPRESVQALVVVLRDPRADYDVRKSAAAALEEIGKAGGEIPKEGVQALLDLLRDRQADRDV